MKYLKRLKKEFQGWGVYEKYIFPTIIFVILLISLYMKDDKIALLSAISGISYTIFAGKGKLLCYFFGIISTFCYSLISYKNGFWGNLALNLFYYLPMQIYGIFKWKKHLKKKSLEIIKTKLTHKNKNILFILSIIFIIILNFILKLFNGKNPLFDSITTILSIAGMILTVYRCIEQWYIWTIVNLLSMIMWIFAYINGSNCFVTIIMWFIYLCTGIYFLHNWKKEIN